MTSRGSFPFGWVILSAALAVPGFLFYRWWSQVKVSNNQQLSQRVRKRLPPGGLFAGVPAGGRLVNPISTESAPALTGVSSQAPQAAPQAAAAAPADPLPRESPQGPGEAPAALQAPPETSPVPGEKPPPASPVLESLRDPMLSPYDRLRLEQMSLEESLARQQVREERRAPARREPPPIESRIELQGIISTEAGVKAIVNGEIVAEGDRVGAVRVVRITPQSVVFAHKKRRFTKTITK